MGHGKCCCCGIVSMIVGGFGDEQAGGAEVLENPDFSGSKTDGDDYGADQQFAVPALIFLAIITIGARCSRHGRHGPGPWRRACSTMTRSRTRRGRW